MSDKDDMFAVDEEFGDLANDDFFSDAEPVKKVTKPEVMRKAAPVEVENDADPLEAPVETEEVEEEPAIDADDFTDVDEEDETLSEAEEDDDDESITEEEVAVEEIKEEPKPVKPKAAKAEPKEKGAGKRAVKPLTPKQKAVNNIYRKAGLESIPTLEHLLRGKQGTKIKVSDIAVFIAEPQDEILKEIFKAMPVLNRVNLSAEVDLARVKVVGGQILGHGRMYQPIQVARIEEDGRLECTSGRHRLVSLALIYGTDIEIPVYIEDMTINEARDAVVVANMARKAKAMEQAEHAVLAAVGGDVDADQDEIYAKTVTTKAKLKKYCTYTVLERGKPAKLAFELGTRKDGALASIGTLEGYWNAALDWHRSMTRKEFDATLVESIKFVNEVALAFQADKSFEADQHMSSMTLSAIGKYYKTLTDAGIKPDVNKLVKVVVAMGGIGRQKSEETYAAICKAMK